MSDKRESRFQEKWLREKDSNGHHLSQWCKQGKSNLYGYCFVCKKEFSCSNAGLSQIKQHATTQSHIRNMRSVSSSTQSRLEFVKVPVASTSSANESTTLAVSTGLRDDVTAAEIIWAGKVAISNFSFRSCDGIVDTFSHMFKCPIANKMTLSRTKLSYLIGDGLGPVYREEMISDLITSGSGFSLQYDETTQTQVKKQMDLLIRYWSPVHNEVWCRFYKSLFFGHAKGELVAQTMIKEMRHDDVPMKKLITLGSDGPNVNKTIWRQMDIRLKAQNLEYPGLVDVGTCNIHVMHNAFSKGLSQYGNVAEQLAVDLHSLFKYSAARREDYKDLQLDLELECQMFQKHTSVRWLSIGPSIRRILDQWVGITEFINVLKSDSSTAPTSAAFKRTLTSLGTNKQATLVQLHFLDCSVTIFEGFLRSFQSKEPQIHRLYDEMCNIVRTLLLRFIKRDVVTERDGVELTRVHVSLRSQQLSDDDMTIGEPTRKELKKLERDTQRRSLLGMRAFFCSTVTYLLQKLPLDNRLLRSLSCLNPQKVKHSSPKDIEYVAKKLNLPDVQVAKASDEWKIFSLADEVECPAPERRIDHYWRDVFDIKQSDGKPKYQVLTEIVKNALVLPHRNADVERALSENTSVVTVDRVSLSETAINGLRVLKDAVKFSDPDLCRPEKLPMSKKVLAAARNSHSEYIKRLEIEKQKEEELRKESASKRAEEEKRKRERDELMSLKSSVLEKESSLEAKEIRLNESLNSAHELLKEGNEKMKSAVESQDFNLIQVAQMMIETATKKTEEYSEKIQEIRKEQKTVEEKKRKLLDQSIDSRCTKRPKSDEQPSTSKSSEAGSSGSKSSKQGSESTSRKSSATGHPSKPQSTKTVKKD